MTVNNPAGGIAKRSIAGAFGGAAETYDQYAMLQRHAADHLLRGIPSRVSPRRILDLGSGTGYCSHRLKGMFPGAEIVCLDISAAMLRYARGKEGGAEQRFVCGDAEALPFPRGVFDLVISNLTIQWCQDYPRLFRELIRVARPGAPCRLSTFGPATLRELREAWREVDAFVHVNEFAAISTLEQSAREQGFERVSARGENIVRHYRDLQALREELKAIGARNMNRDRARGMTGREKLRALQAALNRRAGGDGTIPMTWQLCYLALSSR